MNLTPDDQDLGATGRPLRAGVWIAAGVAVATLVMHLVPGASEALEWDRGGGLPGSLIGWLTGHLTHWSWDHLAWDLAAFLVLSFAALRLIPGRYPFCLLLAAALISVEIALNQPQFATYRGLSGIDSALFGLILAALWRRSADSAGIPWYRILALLGGSGFLLKIFCELNSGATLFVSTESQPFIPAVSAHLSGLGSGLIAGCFLRVTARKLSLSRRLACHSLKGVRGLVGKDETGVLPVNDRRDAGLTVEKRPQPSTIRPKDQSP